jgi:hypothetical protein
MGQGNVELPEVGATIWVCWGKFGNVKAQVQAVTKNGLVYASRWNKKRGQFTTARRLYPYQDYWATDDYWWAGKDK